MQTPLTIDQADQQAEAARLVLYRLGELGEKGIGQIRQYQADGARATGTHCLGCAIWPVSELAGDLEHLATGGLADVRTFVEHIRNRGDRDTNRRGDVFYRYHPQEFFTVPPAVV